MRWLQWFKRLRGKNDTTDPPTDPDRKMRLPLAARRVDAEPDPRERIDDTETDTDGPYRRNPSGRINTRR